LNSQATTNPDIHVLEQLFAIARRRWMWVVFFALVGVVAGYVHALNQVPAYATSATVMVRSGPAADPLRQGIETSTPEEEGQFLSQLELARSASVAKMVADRLGLVDDAAFAAPGKSRVERLLARVIGDDDAKPAPLTIDDVVARLQAGAKVLRVGRTYVAAISYTHPDGAVAQKVAQAFAESFRQKIGQENDVANSRLRAALQGEIDRATGPGKEALQARLQDLMVSRSLPGMDVLVMNDARLPLAPIAPRTSFLAAVGLILGAVVGCAIAGFRELTDRGLRDGDQLARLTGVRFLGYLPRRAPRTGSNVTIGNGQPVPESARRVAADPHSAFAETVRAISVAMISTAVEGRGQITGLTSVLPGDSTAVLAANLAIHLASIGRSVLLVDGDAREAAVSKWLAAGAETGIVPAARQVAGRLCALRCQDQSFRPADGVRRRPTGRAASAFRLGPRRALLRQTPQPVPARDRRFRVDRPGRRRARRSTLCRRISVDRSLGQGDAATGVGSAGGRAGSACQAFGHGDDAGASRPTAALCRGGVARVVPEADIERLIRPAISLRHSGGGGQNLRRSRSLRAGLPA
jgi:capsular polysaccharide biosynthesis protein